MIGGRFHPAFNHRLSPQGHAEAEYLYMIEPVDGAGTTMPRNTICCASAANELIETSASLVSVRRLFPERRGQR